MWTRLKTWLASHWLALRSSLGVARRPERLWGDWPTDEEVVAAILSVPGHYGFTDEGFGTTITFATSGYVFFIDSVSDGPGAERAVIETDHMTTTEGWITKQPSDRKDPGEITVNVHHDPSFNWVAALALPAETITVTFPVPAGLTNGGTVAFSGFITSYKPNIPKDGKQTATLILAVSGKPTHTAAS